MSDKRAPRRSLDDWMELVTECRQSGLTDAAWCKAQGMGENPLLIKERLGHEKIQTTLGTYGHLYPNTNIEIAKKLTGVLSYQSASQSIANYTSNQHTAMYHKEI